MTGENLLILLCLFMESGRFRHEGLYPFHGVQGVEGSNPSVPTKFKKAYSIFAVGLFHCGGGWSSCLGLADVPCVLIARPGRR